MKKTIVKLFALILVCCTVSLSLISCGIDMGDGKDHVNGFFDAVSEEDFEKAATFLHPEIDADVKALFEEVETSWGVEVKDGISVKTYTGFKTVIHDTSVDGSVLTFSLVLEIDTVSTTAQVTLVENDSGFGIYWFNIDPLE